MGIDVQTLKLLMLARGGGVDFRSTLTVGRQDILVGADEIERTFRLFGHSVNKSEASKLSGQGNNFNESIIRKLGAQTVDFMDVSDFEGATVIQDLNRSLDDKYVEKYSLVFDGGTLEHVFNPVAALQNYMALPSIGGHLIIAVPANNEMGHGFYQFSPEIFFRLLSPINGYEAQGIFLCQMYKERDWWLVRDPKIAGKRVGLNNERGPIYVFVIAKKLAAVKSITETPMQSDYALEWKSGQKISAGHSRTAVTKVKAMVSRAFPARAFDTLMFLRDAWRNTDDVALSRFRPERSTLQF